MQMILTNSDAEIAEIGREELNVNKKSSLGGSDMQMILTNSDAEIGREELNVNKKAPWASPICK